MNDTIDAFQSAPADCRRENAVANVFALLLSMFQSAPADCRRENCPAWPSSRSFKSFNPLPPTVGGRISQDSTCTLISIVSIRSRRLSAGEYEGPDQLGRSGRVSIRSRRLSAGECTRRSLPRGRLHVSIRSRRLSAGE